MERFILLIIFTVYLGCMFLFCNKRGQAYVDNDTAMTTTYEKLAEKSCYEEEVVRDSGTKKYDQYGREYTDYQYSSTYSDNYADKNSDTNSQIIDRQVNQAISMMFTDREQAMEIFEIASKESDDAKFLLGYMYDFEGQNMDKQNYPLARAYYEQVADSNPYALICLGYMYQYGKGVEPDNIKAKSYFDKARAMRTKQGGEYTRYDAVSSYLLGQMYMNGQAQAHNTGLAKVWLKRASREGNPEASYALYGIYSNGDEPVDMDKANQYLEKAAMEGNTQAMVKLGCNYYYTFGDAVDYSEALYLWWKAASNGNDEAYACLAMAYYEGRAVGRSDDVALNLFRSAVRCGNKDCLDQMVMIGWKYYEGGSDEDLEMAKSYWTEACNLGSAMARKLLNDKF